MAREISKLPIDRIRSEYLKEYGGPCLVKASTGSGKSTRIPIWLFEEGIPFIIVQPRRVIVRSLYQYLKPLFSEQLSFQIRYESHFVNNPRALIVTPGIFLNYLQSGFPFEPELILFDEAHERGRELDFALAVLKLRKFSSITLLSATLDDVGIQHYLDFKIFALEEARYKIELIYSEHTLLPSFVGLENQIRSNLKLHSHNSALVFLPGKSELYRVRDFLANWKCPVFCMHGGVSPEEQRIILEHPGPKVILSTNLLESAVTVEGVDLVIDSGFHKILQFRDGREVLSTEFITHASATQRMGRTGRNGPGKCIRLWSSRATLQSQIRPEILRSKLTDLGLRAINLELNPRSLPFLNSPNEYQWDHADREIKRYFNKADQIIGGSELSLGVEFLAIVKQLKLRKFSNSFIDHILFLCAFRQTVGDFSKWLEIDFENSKIEGPLDLWVRKKCLPKDLKILWDNLRSTFHISGTGDLTVSDRNLLMSSLMELFPEHSFWIHPKKNLVLHNDYGGECLLTPKLKHEEMKACFVFSFFELEGPRKNRVSQAELAIPILKTELVKLPVTRTEQKTPRIVNGNLVSSVTNFFGPNKISEEEKILRGHELRKALTEENLIEFFLPGFHEYHYYYDLFRQECEINNKYSLDVILENLGFEEIRDFEFIDLDDLFCSKFISRLASLKDEYPRSLQEPGGIYSLSYDLGRREVYFEQRKKGKEPSKLLLARFRNWKCFLRSGGRCVRL
tara:strand:- start:670 stop:2883 length:2214 start_codon:yes stop_codon:yes gene_type:complete